MKFAKSIGVMAAVAAAGLGSGLAAAVASASWDISGGNYSGSSSGPQVFTFDGTVAVRCSNVSVAGNTDNVVGEPEATRFVPSFGSCNTLGLPATVVSDPWKLSITGGSAGGYTANILLETGNIIRMAIPLTGCVADITGPQAFVASSPPDRAGVLASTGGVHVSTYTASLAYTASRCPFSTAGSATYDSGFTPISIAGVGVTP